MVPLPIIHLHALHQRWRFDPPGPESGFTQTTKLTVGAGDTTPLSQYVDENNIGHTVSFLIVQKPHLTEHTTPLSGVPTPIWSIRNSDADQSQRHTTYINSTYHRRHQLSSQPIIVGRNDLLL